MKVHEQLSKIVQFNTKKNIKMMKNDLHSPYFFYHSCQQQQSHRQQNRPVGIQESVHEVSRETLAAGRMAMQLQKRRWKRQRTMPTKWPEIESRKMQTTTRTLRERAGQKKT
jgi:hypothetical protein